MSRAGSRAPISCGAITIKMRAGLTGHSRASPVAYWLQTCRLVHFYFAKRGAFDVSTARQPHRF